MPDDLLTASETDPGRVATVHPNPEEPQVLHVYCGLPIPDQTTVVLLHFCPLDGEDTIRRFYGPEA